MKKLLVVALLTAVLAACGPQSPATNPPSVVTEPPAVASATPAALTVEPATQAAPSEEATALPIATSRGPNLEATDPTSVSLASGGVQFVEFFRFT